MDKCKREKEKIYEYACGASYNYFLQDCSSSDSFFTKRNDKVYIREYNFENIQDLKEELTCMWGQDEIMQQCMQAVLVAALKLKPEEGVVLEAVVSKENMKEKLPSYIYNM